MGQAKLKQRGAFPAPLVEEWEAELCINFAVALARLTNWILHVDWWTPSTDRNADVPIEQMRPLRVYVGDNHDQVFDVRGIRSVEDFAHRTIEPLGRQYGTGGITTRFYSEEKLSELPLPGRLDERPLARATAAIESNATFLESISKRPAGGIPAYLAATFTFGRCAVFAEALRELTGLVPVALIADRYMPRWAGGRIGYIHSMLMHPDGSVEDVWGRSSVSEVARRFQVAEHRLSFDEHQRVVNELKRDSPTGYERALAEAREALAAIPRVGT